MYISAGLWVEGPIICAFMMVALKTSVGEVTYCSYASMLLRNDMIDFAGFRLAVIARADEDLIHEKWKPFDFVFVILDTSRFHHPWPHSEHGYSSKLREAREGGSLRRGVGLVRRDKEVNLALQPRENFVCGLAASPSMPVGCLRYQDSGNWELFAFYARLRFLPDKNLHA